MSINKALKNKTKMFKNGNSWGVRVTSKDRQALKADKNTRFEAVDASLNAFMDHFYQKHGDLMKELENK